MTAKLFQSSRILFYCIINNFSFFLEIINDKKFFFSIIFYLILSSRFLDNSKKLCDFLWRKINIWKFNLKVFLRWNCNEKKFEVKNLTKSFPGENKFHRLSAQFPIILFLFDWLNKAKINPLDWDRQDNSMFRNWFSFPKDSSKD